ncbi:hypothetical protein F2P81_006012 [Scophthalmus maximus]|uniref:Uncharacterized protein n=1 Tax=Scophthalmus maximus TaxID=52904 RepID=A0A6A4TFF3_SCOMX|nr:hypothetical protein F2P81_006012 [Scophthalmus maximus]
MNMTSEEMDALANMLVSGIMEETTMNLDDLMQSIYCWDSEERAKSKDCEDDFTLGPGTLQKVNQYLENFFAIRRMIAENSEKVLVDQEATIHSLSPAMSDKEGDEGDNENISILETKPSSSLSTISEGSKVAVSSTSSTQSFTTMFKEDKNETASDFQQHTRTYEVLRADTEGEMSTPELADRGSLTSKERKKMKTKEEKTLKSTSPGMSEKEGNDRAGENVTIPEIRPSPSLPKSSPESLKAVPSASSSHSIKPMFEENKNDTASDSQDHTRTYGVLGEAADNEGEKSTPETADRGCLTSERRKKKKKMKKEKTLSRTSPSKSEKEGEDGENVTLPYSIPKIRPSSSLSKRSEESRKAILSASSSHITKTMFEDDKNDTASDSQEHIRPHEVLRKTAVTEGEMSTPEMADRGSLTSEKRKKEKTLSSTSPGMLEKDGDDSDSENITIPEIRQSTTLSKRSEEGLKAAVSASSSHSIKTMFKEDKKETASSSQEHTRPYGVLREAADTDGEMSTPEMADRGCLTSEKRKKKMKVKTLSSTPSGMSEKEGEDGEEITVPDIIPEIRSSSSLSKRSEESRKAVSSASSSHSIKAMFEENKNETSDFQEQMTPNRFQKTAADAEGKMSTLETADRGSLTPEKTKNAKKEKTLHSTSPGMLEKEEEDREGENINIPDIIPEKRPSSSNAKISKESTKAVKKPNGVVKAAADMKMPARGTKKRRRNRILSPAQQHVKQDSSSLPATSSTKDDPALPEDATDGLQNKEKTKRKGLFYHMFSRGRSENNEDETKTKCFPCCTPLCFTCDTTDQV